MAKKNPSRTERRSPGRILLALGKLVLFLASLAILYYEFIVGPRHGKEPDPTIVIAAIGLAAATISLRWDFRG